MSTTSSHTATSRIIFAWKGKDKMGKIVHGELHAAGKAMAIVTLRRQGVVVTKIKKKPADTGKKISDKDITLFTRQLATMLKAGVSLLQSFEMIAKGHTNPAAAKLINDIRASIEMGSSLSLSFSKFPAHFDPLFCNLIYAGEQAGILEDLFMRLPIYKEKTLAMKNKIKSALFYPISIMAVALVVTAVIMIWVVPSFKDIFKSFGATLPTPTLLIIAISDFFVQYCYILFTAIFAGLYSFFQAWKRSVKIQRYMDVMALKIPIFGTVIQKAIISRWARTLATMFAAGVPLVESLESVAGAAGNALYFEATRKVQSDVNSGTSLTTAIQNTTVFPNMATQMIAIGEESGSLDHMLNKIADFYEEEVDQAIASLSTLMEPVIMVILGLLVGGLVIAMYLPIFKLGALM